ncbi:MAG: YraN family protein [Saccharofermentans sp.]|nr:YraN family protein [Saccharofermentans sp.]
MKSVEIGKIAEAAVESQMKQEGYRLVCKNYAVHNVGELDLVFEKDEDIYVVEVRSRSNKGPYPTSAETVTPAKQRKIFKCTGYMLRHYGFEDRNVVFLIGQVTHNKDCLVQNVEIIPF